MEDIFGVPQKAKHRIPIWPSDSVPRNIPQKLKTETQTDNCMSMFMAALFTIAETWNQSKCALSDEWISVMRYIHTNQCYSAMKRNEVLTPATTWMNLMLSERCQAQQATYYIVPLTWNIQSGQSHKDRKQISGCQGLDRGRTGSHCLMGVGSLSES